MKAYHVLVLASAATLCSSAAFGFTELARGELVLSTTARAMYDSRVFGGVNPADDYIYTLDPRLIYRRAAGELKLDATLGTRINRYQTFTDLNSEDLVTSLKLSLPPEGASMASGAFEVGYDEHTDVNYDVNQRLREKSFMTRLTGNVPLGLKTSLLLGGMFSRDQRIHFNDRESREGSAGFRYTDFLGGSAFDVQYRHLEVDTTGGNIWLIPLNQRSDIYSATFSRPLYHDVRGSISYGYRVLHRSRAEVFSGKADSGGSIINVKIDGPFLPESMFPKVESSLSLGYQKAETPGINDTAGSRFVGVVHLGWNARERTQVFLDARRSLDLSINDLTVETTGANLGIHQRIGNFFNATLSGGYENRDYRTLSRTDHIATGSAGLGYRITRTWSADAEYRLRAANSTSSTADYSRHVVSASVTYLF